MMKYVRATSRSAITALFIPFLAASAALQGLIVGPVTGNYTTIPNFLYNCMRKICGLKVEFNAASAAVTKDKSVWFVANHMSNADFFILGSTLEGTFAGKGDIMKWPLIGQMARAVKYIGLRRSKEFNGESRAKIIKNFNAGFNTIMFPEGTTTEGKKVHLFHAGLITLLFGDKGIDKGDTEVALKKDVVVQPVAIRVKSVEGKDAIGNDQLRNLYSLQDEKSMVKTFWKLFQIRSMTLELTTFAPLNPKDFGDAKDMINKAAQDIASVVNPGQTVFEKAVIPGQQKKAVAPKT